MDKYTFEGRRQRDEFCNVRDAIRRGRAEIVSQRVAESLDKSRQYRTHYQEQDDMQRKQWKHSLIPQHYRVAYYTRFEAKTQSEAVAKEVAVAAARRHRLDLEISEIDSKLNSENAEIGDTAAFQKNVHANRMSIEAAKTDHERRRRTVLVAQTEWRDNFEKQRQAQRMTAMVQQECQNERALNQIFTNCVNMGAVILANRKVWDAVRAEFAEVTAPAEAKRKELELLVKLEKTELAIEVQQRAFRDARRDGRAAVINATSDWVQSVLEEVAGIAVDCCQLRSRSDDKDMLSPAWEDVMASFIKSSPIPQQQAPSLALPTFADLKYTLPECACDLEISRFFKFQCAWKLPEGVERVVCSEVADIIAQCMHMSLPQPDDLPLIWPGPHPLRLCITGPPGSGVRRIASLIAEGFPGLRLVQFETVAAVVSGEVLRNGEPLGVDVTADFVAREVAELISSGVDFLLVGFPETGEQYFHLEKSLGSFRQFPEALKRRDAAFAELHATAGCDFPALHAHHSANVTPSLDGIIALTPVAETLISMSDASDGLGQKVYGYYAGLAEIKQIVENSSFCLPDEIPIVSEIQSAEEAKVLIERLIAMRFYHETAEKIQYPEIVSPSAEKLKWFDKETFAYLSYKWISIMHATRVSLREAFTLHRATAESVLVSAAEAESVALHAFEDSSFDAGRQAAVDALIAQWNEFLKEYDELATTVHAQEEMGLRVQATINALLEIAKQRKQSFNDVITKFKDSGIIEASLIACVRVTADLIRAEARRFAGESQILIDANKLASGAALPATPQPLPDISLPQPTASVTWFESAMSFQVTLQPIKGGKAEVPDPSVQPGLDQLKAGFEQKLSVITKWGVQWFGETRGKFDAVVQRMQNWSAARVAAEVAAVEAFGMFMRQKILNAEAVSTLRITATKISYGN